MSASRTKHGIAALPLHNYFDDSPGILVFVIKIYTNKSASVFDRS